MKSSKEIVSILHSIEDVRLDKDGDLEVQFKDGSIFPDGWEPNARYIHGSFTEQLFLLIEAELKGELEK